MLNMVTQQGRGERGPRGVLFYGYVEENERPKTQWEAIFSSALLTQVPADPVPL